MAKDDYRFSIIEEVSYEASFFVVLRHALIALLRNKESSEGTVVPRSPYASFPHFFPSAAVPLYDY